MKLLRPSSQIPFVGDALERITRLRLQRDFLTSRELPNYEIAVREHAALRPNALVRNGKLVLRVGHSLYKGSLISNCYIALHRYLMEVAAGCYLPREVKVTMADGDPFNVHPDNLILHKQFNIRNKYCCIPAARRVSPLPTINRHHQAAKRGGEERSEANNVSNRHIERRVRELESYYLTMPDSVIEECIAAMRAHSLATPESVGFAVVCAAALVEVVDGDDLFLLAAAIANAQPALVLRIKAMMNGEQDIVLR